MSSSGTYVIMGDSDDSYDFSALSLFTEKLSEGYDLVMGNRFSGGIKPDAMPFLHRYLGIRSSLSWGVSCSISRYRIFIAACVASEEVPMSSGVSLQQEWNLHPKWW